MHPLGRSVEDEVHVCFYVFLGLPGCSFCSLSALHVKFRGLVWVYGFLLVGGLRRSNRFCLAAKIEGVQFALF